MSEKPKKGLDEMLIELIRAETDGLGELVELDEPRGPAESGEPDWVKIRRGEAYRQAYLQLTARLDSLIAELETARDEAEELVDQLAPDEFACSQCK